MQSLLMHCILLHTPPPPPLSPTQEHDNQVEDTADKVPQQVVVGHRHVLYERVSIEVIPWAVGWACSKRNKADHKHKETVLLKPQDAQNTALRNWKTQLKYSDRSTAVSMPFSE